MLFHFKFLYERDADSSSLHNLALTRSDCKLPISAVQGYKAAFAMGETFSAANLGYIYLDCGMGDEAKTVIQDAIKIEGHDSRAEKCLAEITQRSEDEKSKETELLATASATKDFLVGMGRALRDESPTVIGTWKFPFGEMTLVGTVGEVNGTADIKTEQPGFGFLLHQAGDAPIVKTHRHSLKGKLNGRVFSFKLNVSDIGAGNPLAVNTFASLLGSAGVTRQGFIVFAAKENSATYVEVAEQKLGKIETIIKIK